MKKNGCKIFKRKSIKVITSEQKYAKKEQQLLRRKVKKKIDF